MPVEITLTIADFSNPELQAFLYRPSVRSKHLGVTNSTTYNLSDLWQSASAGQTGRPAKIVNGLPMRPPGLDITEGTASLRSSQETSPPVVGLIRRTQRIAKTHDVRPPFG